MQWTFRSPFACAPERLFYKPSPGEMNESTSCTMSSTKRIVVLNMSMILVLRGIMSYNSKDKKKTPAKTENFHRVLTEEGRIGWKIAKTKPRTESSNQVSKERSLTKNKPSEIYERFLLKNGLFPTWTARKLQNATHVTGWMSKREDVAGRPVMENAVGFALSRTTFVSRLRCLMKKQTDCMRSQRSSWIGYEESFWKMDYAITRSQTAMLVLSLISN